MITTILEEIIYHVTHDFKKFAAVILIIFFAGFTMGFCAGNVVEKSLENTLNDAQSAEVFTP